MSVNYSIPRGTYDILPETSYKWQYVLKTFQETAKLFNFKEIVTPIFEKADLFERSVGDTSDIVEKEMYKFNDKKGRKFALRPEGTAPVIRSFVENNLGFSGNLCRLFYSGPMFRYDRPQKGRYRQFYQYGIEAIGSNHPYIDAEVIAFADTFLRNLGLKNYNLEINSVGCSICTQDYDLALKEYFSPHFDELCPDCKKRMGKNPKRLLDCKVKSCQSIAKNAPSMIAYLDEDCRTHFEQVKFYLDKMGIVYKVNDRIVRGLDYYTNTAFEFLNNNLGAQNALLGGGRYNGLVKQIGGKETPGVGFAGGIERLLLSLEQEELFCGKNSIPEIFFITLGKNAQIKGVELIAKLRNMGISIVTEIEKESMKSQMKAANKSNALFAIIIGEEELSNNELVLKDLQVGNQKMIAFKDIGEIKEIIDKAK